MAVTDYFEKLLLDHALNQQPFSIEDWYVGLWLTDPTVGGDLTGEVTADDYGRKLVDWTSAFDNDAQIDWAAATSVWGTVNWLALVNSPNKGSGNVLAYEATGPFDVQVGRPLTIPLGGLVMVAV